MEWFIKDAEEVDIVVWVVYLTTIFLSLCRLCRLVFGTKYPFNFDEIYRIFHYIINIIGINAVLISLYHKLMFLIFFFIFR